ncbi:MAG: hypothetical protein K2R98_15930 [Gemmataceae bacterium]|nr:hypothetical protein [Gemmataceae bacterium]
MPADNNGSERDIRSLAAARNDGRHSPRRVEGRGVCPHQERDCHGHEERPPVHQLRSGGGTGQTPGPGPCHSPWPNRSNRPRTTPLGNAPVRAERRLNSYE